MIGMTVAEVEEVPLLCPPLLAKMSEREGLTWIPHETWTPYGNNWEAAYRNRRHHLLTESRANPENSQLQILKELGFQFEDTGVVIPSLILVLEKYEAKIQSLLTSGKIREKDTIRPARVFKDKQGHYHFLDLRLFPEFGWQEVYSTVLPAAIMGEMIAAGYFPISNFFRVHHDFAHITGFYEHPQYMAALRKLAVVHTKEIDKPRKEDRIQRFFFALEGLALVPRENKDTLLPLLAEPFRETLVQTQDRLLTVEELKKYFYTKNDPWLRQHASQLLQKYETLVNWYGGAAREMGNVYVINFEIRESLDVMAELVKRFFDFTTERQKKYFVHDLARLEVALWESTRLTPELFVEEVMKKDIPSHSPIYRFFVSSGISDYLDDSTLEIVNKNTGRMAQSILGTLPPKP